MQQTETTLEALNPDVPSVLSIFAGRIADTGRDPLAIVCQCVKAAAVQPRAEVLWASVREVLNIFHAGQSGCHIVTVPHDILAKAERTWGMNLEALSSDTVKMFANDAATAGFKL